MIILSVTLVPIGAPSLGHYWATMCSIVVNVNVYLCCKATLDVSEWCVLEIRRTTVVLILIDLAHLGELLRSCDVRRPSCVSRHVL
jgi:hypothetical protein